MGGHYTRTWIPGGGAMAEAAYHNYFVVVVVRERIKTRDRDILLYFHKYRYFYTKILIFV